MYGLQYESQMLLIGSLGFGITQVTSENCYQILVFQFKVRSACWPWLTRKSRRSGLTKPIRLLKKARDEGARIVFEDEASFRQDSTLYRTWSRIGEQPLVPVTGQRESVKVFGCVDIQSAEFEYMMDDVFNHKTYMVFLETLKVD